MNELEVLSRIEQVRRRVPARITGPITMAHGSGGRAMQELIDVVFMRAFANPQLAARADAAIVQVGSARVALSTDAFVVKPLFFPGGDIGSLAVHGTVNDLAMVGAQPLALTASFVLEEGFEIALLDRIVASMRSAAAEAGVAVVAGDTKVVERGKADGVYITTTGIGLLADDIKLGADQIRANDVVLVSGTIGDHGAAVMVARGELELESDLLSDSAPLNELVQQILTEFPDSVRVLRDATRGGVATVIAELAQQANLSITLHERALPLSSEVRGACELLGLDPLYVANEGKFVAVIEPAAAQDVQAFMQRHRLGKHAAIIGEVHEQPAGMVFLKTITGGTRVVDLLAGEQLPRIC